VYDSCGDYGSCGSCDRKAFLVGLLHRNLRDGSLDLVHGGHKLHGRRVPGVDRIRGHDRGNWHMRRRQLHRVSVNRGRTVWRRREQRCLDGKHPHRLCRPSLRPRSSLHPRTGDEQDRVGAHVRTALSEWCRGPTAPPIVAADAPTNRFTWPLARCEVAQAACATTESHLLFRSS